MSIQDIKFAFNTLNDQIELLNQKYKEKKTNIEEISEFKKIIPTLDEELNFWKDEIKRIGNNPQMEEELVVWTIEVKGLEKSKKEKKSELKILLMSQKVLEDDINSLENNIKKNSEFLKKDSLSVLKLNKKELNNDNIFEVFKILKKLLETNENKENDMLTFISFLQKSEINLDAKLLKLTAKIYNEDIKIIPKQIINFISFFNKNNQLKVLDLWPTNGYGLISLLDNQEITYVTYIPSNSKAIFDNVFSAENVSYENINDLKVHKQLLDLIIGYAPDDNIKIDYQTDGSKIISDKKSYIEFFRYCQNLNNEGNAFFIVKSDFLLNRKDKSVLFNISDFNIFINAIFDLSEFNSPLADFILILLSQKSSKKIFVGSISQNEKDNQLLYKNFHRKKEGKIPQYGSYTSLDNFYSFNTFIKNLDVTKYFDQKSLISKPVSFFAEEINFHDDKGEYDDIPNSIYISNNDSLDVTTSLEKIITDKNSYFQVVFDPVQAFDEYVAKYLNTALGLKIRAPLSLKTDDQSLLMDILSKIEFYLPKIDDQLEIIRTEALIRDISTRANFQREELWRNPENYIKIRELLKTDNSNAKYNFEKWIESLPFPLSSILWECITTSKYEHKVKYLLNFFEAFSELNVIILLSGLMSDSNFFNEEFSNCITNRKFPFWFYSPSFGNWNFFGRCLSRTIQMLSYNKYKFSKCLELFGNPEREFILNLTSERLYNILHEVSKYRNSWDAHGPVVNEDLYKNRYEILRNSLSKFYEIIGNTFDNSYLILPESNEYKEGIYFYKIRKFMGANPKFRSVKIESTTPLDSDRIYLYSKEQTKPIELLTLIIFTKNTCYFYNHKDNISNQIQYVSYHNKENPESEFSENIISQFKSLFERNIKDYR